MAQTRSEKPDDTGTNGNQSDKTTLDSNSMDPKRGAAVAQPDAQNDPNDPIALLKADHRHVEQLFGAFEKAANASEKSHLAEQLCNELMVHTLIEEDIFYPACRDHVEQRLLDEAQVEHDGAKALIAEILSGSPNDEYFDAKVKVLSEEIKHHVREEEKPGEGILAKAKAASIATLELAQRLAARRKELMEEVQAGTLGPPETRTFRAHIKAGTKTAWKENGMARTMTMERDARGRFVDEDDDRDYRRSRSRYDDDDRSRMPPRDEEGRFMSRDEDEGYRRSSRSRYEDEDDYRGGGSRYAEDDYMSDSRRRGQMRGAEMRHERAERAPHDQRGYAEDMGQGGWFGDPRGHSEASRRGWDNPDHGRSGWYGDPRGHSEASRRGWDDPDHRPSGWFGDPERHSEASQRGWDNPEHGRSGWYGDPRGHSEAARRGWDERGDTRTRSRYYDDDDDDYGRRHGGWYGDPEGHSRAARRGRR